jgi:hypothetical protein
MRTRDFIAGINILLPYYDNYGGYHIGAEHDKIHTSPTDRALTLQDVEKMVALGWHQEYDDFIEEGEKFAPKHYRPEEAWIAYV